MNKALYILPMIMASSLFAMQENNSAHTIVIQDGNSQRVSTYPINMGPLKYTVVSKLKDTKYKLLICLIQKDKNTILAEYMQDLLSGNEGKRYVMQQENSGANIVPTVIPLMCVCSPENNDIFFETREFGVKKGGEFLISFDKEDYSLVSIHDNHIDQTDMDSIANGMARHRQRTIKPKL